MKYKMTIFLISALAFLIHGYQFAVTDQAIFIPYILKSHEPDLFPSDLLFSQSSAFSSLFYSVLGFLTRFADIQLIFFVLYLIFNYLFFIVLYQMAKIFLTDEKLSYLALLPFVVPKFIAGTGIYTSDTYFGYKSVGIISLLYFLIFLFKKKFIKASISASVGFLFHPLSIIPSYTNLPVLIFKSNKSSKKMISMLCKSIIVSVVLITPYFLMLNHSNLIISQVSHLFDKDWLQIIRLRDDYLFPTSWSNVEWAALLFYILLIIIFYNRLNISLKKTLLTVLIVSLSIFTLNFLLLDIIKSPIFAQFQLIRSVVPLAYISFILSPFFITYQDKYLKTLGLSALICLYANSYKFLILATILFAIILFIKKPETNKTISNKLFASILIVTFLVLVSINFRSFSNVHQKYQIPKPVNYWMDVQKWAISNTGKDEKFTVLPRQIGFRIFSKRQIIPDVKDGAVVMYSPQYAKKWQEASDDFANFYLLSEEQFLTLKSKYNFNYIVTIKEHNLNFPIAYRNDYYVVYKL